jgi:hypothetical protein
MQWFVKNMRFALYSGLMIGSDVTPLLFKGIRPSVAPLSAWFQDPDGVRQAVDVAWWNLKLSSGLEQTINNPVDYRSLSTERVTMTGLVNWAAPFTRSFTNHSTLLTSMSYMWADMDADNRYKNWTQADVKASECGLYLCVNEYETEIIGGTVSERAREVSAQRKVGSYQVQGSDPETSLSIINLLDANLRTQRTDLEIEVPASTATQGPFRMTQAGVTGLITAITGFFDDGAMWFTQPDLRKGDIIRTQFTPGMTGIVRLVHNSQQFEYMPAVMESFWNNRGNDRLSILFQNLAASLTNAIRATADDRTAFAGSQRYSIAIFEVRWRWIVPSGLGVLLAIIFQIIVWYECKRTKTPIWKGSVLAILFHGLSHRLKMSIPPRISKSETDEQAKSINVELRETDNGLCLGEFSPLEFMS